VKDREGRIVVSQEHNLYTLTDSNIGKLTDTRIHPPSLFTKEIDLSSPPFLFLLNACQQRTLSKSTTRKLI